MQNVSYYLDVEQVKLRIYLMQCILEMIQQNID